MTHVLFEKIHNYSILYSLQERGIYCGNFSRSSSRIGSGSIDDLNTSKAKLRGAKYQREKTKTGSFS